MGLVGCEELLNRCVHVLDSYQHFDSSAENINNVEEIFESINSLGRTDQIFISETFLGCCAFSELLNIVINNFYEYDKNALISHKTLLKIVAYLVTFRWKEIGKDGLSEIILQMNQVDAIIQFLKHYLDEKSLSSNLKLQWYDVCDDDFVDDLIVTLIRSINDVNEACDHAVNILKLMKKSKKCSRKDARCCGELLLSLKMKMMTQETSSKLLKYDEDENTKLNNWKMLFNQFVEGIHMPIHQIDVNNNNNNNNKNNNNNNRLSIPDIVSKNKSKVNVIRLNTAAILREGHLYKKKEKETLKKIDQWETGSGDPIKFDEWQTRVKEEAGQKRFEEVALMRLMGRLTQEKSIIAKQKSVEDKKKMVELMRTHAGGVMQQYLVMKVEEEDKMREKHKKVNSMKKDSKEARWKMMELKAKVVQGMQEEMKEMMRIALMEAEEEMKQRLEVIRKIRDLEMNMTKVRSKVVDLNETSGCGLHTEMSISELRERLKQMQAEEVKRLEEKKNEILQNKKMREQMIQTTLTNIAKHRDDIAKAACLRSDEKNRITSMGRHKTSAILELEIEFQNLKSQRLDKNRYFEKAHNDCTNENKRTNKSRLELLAV